MYLEIIATNMLVSDLPKKQKMFVTAQTPDSTYLKSALLSL